MKYIQAKERFLIVCKNRDDSGKPLNPEDFDPEILKAINDGIESAMQKVREKSAKLGAEIMAGKCIARCEQVWRSEYYVAGVFRFRETEVVEKKTQSLELSIESVIQASPFGLDPDPNLLLSRSRGMS